MATVIWVLCFILDEVCFCILDKWYSSLGSLCLVVPLQIFDASKVNIWNSETNTRRIYDDIVLLYFTSTYTAIALCIVHVQIKHKRADICSSIWFIFNLKGDIFSEVKFTVIIFFFLWQYNCSGTERNIYLGYSTLSKHGHESLTSPGTCSSTTELRMCLIVLSPDLVWWIPG